MLSFPSPLEVASTIALLILCLWLTSLLSGVLRPHPVPIAIANPRREAFLALALAAAVFAVTAMFEVYRYSVYRPAFHLDERPPFTVDQFDVIFTALFYTPWYVLLLLIMSVSKQNPRSIGVASENAKTALALGLGLSAVYFAVVGVFAWLVLGATPNISASLVYGLMNNAIIAASEEVVWRGHIQTRIVALTGPVRGLSITSVMFALLHFPQRYFLYSGTIIEALASSLLVTAAGLFFGYIMLKTQNIIAPSLVHMFGNWSSLFWSMSSF